MNHYRKNTGNQRRNWIDGNNWRFLVFYTTTKDFHKYLYGQTMVSTAEEWYVGNVVYITESNVEQKSNVRFFMSIDHINVLFLATIYKTSHPYLYISHPFQCQSSERLSKRWYVKTTGQQQIKSSIIEVRSGIASCRENNFNWICDVAVRLFFKRLRLLKQRAIFIGSVKNSFSSFSSFSSR